jgi:DNA-directed RNA polymerase subunit beta'
MILDTVKELGFRFATLSGVTISKNDIVTPARKEAILAEYENKVEKAHQQYLAGFITDEERKKKVTDLWTQATDDVGVEMQKNLYELNPVFMMANSGARGSFKQIRQLAGMRGLMANPKGEIIERPIRSNFMEGLTVLEYFISTHGARKGLADTALRTADSGYLTRRLVDVSQDVIVREEDCGTDLAVEVPAFTLDRRRFFEMRSNGVVEARITSESFAPKQNEQIVGRVLAADIDPDAGLSAGQPISRHFGELIFHAKAEAVRSLLQDVEKHFVGKSVDKLDPLAIAEAIPGLDELASLFRRERAGEDPFLTLEAVEDLRTPEKFLRRMEDGGYASAGPHAGRSPEDVSRLQLRTLVWALNELLERACTVAVRSVLTCEAPIGVCGACYGLSLATQARSDVGDAIGIIAAQSIGEPGTQLTMRTFHTGGVAGADITHGLPRVVELFEARTPKLAGAVSHITGRAAYRDKTAGPFVYTLPLSDDIEVREIEGENTVIFYRGERMTRQLHEWLTRGVQYTRSVAPVVEDGQIVVEGQPVLPGVLSPTDLMASGLPRATRYLVEEVQRVYRDQGVEINDKHIEVIARQMTRRVLVDHPGSTEYLPGQYVEVHEFWNKRNELDGRRNGGDDETELPTGDQQMLGITKASLATESFLSAASFQETTKVLTDAAIEGKIDRLAGLKENVIIGKLIPASTGLRQYRSIEIAPVEGYATGLMGDFGYSDDLADGLGVRSDDLVPLEGIENLGGSDRPGVDE